MILRCTVPLISYMDNNIEGYLNQVNWKINKPDTFCVNISVLPCTYSKTTVSKHKQMQSQIQYQPLQAEPEFINV
jgi:hypothetical protein